MYTYTIECSGMPFRYIGTFQLLFLAFISYFTPLQPFNSSPTPHLIVHLLALVDLFFTLLHKHKHILQCFGSMRTSLHILGVALAHWAGGHHTVHTSGRPPVLVYRA